MIFRKHETESQFKNCLDIVIIAIAYRNGGYPSLYFTSISHLFSNKFNIDVKRPSRIKRKAKEYLD